MNKLKKNDIILVKPASFGVNLSMQYAAWHNISDLECMSNIVHELFPEYDADIHNFFEKNNRLSLYCMFIARYDFFDKYFTWLFKILFEVEKRIDTSKYDARQKRVLAFLAERLLNVYVYHNELKVIYEPIYFINRKSIVSRLFGLSKS